MPHILTGNALMDALVRGPYVKNPAYNPKTKKGSKEAPFLIDTSAGQIGEGTISHGGRNAADILDRTPSEYGYTEESLAEDNRLGITASPYNTQEELTNARAKNQSASEKVWNATVRAGLGEVVLGTLEGFGNIFDGLANIVTGGEYKDSSAYTDAMHQAKQQLDDNFQIYKRDGTFNVGDLGWWMDNAVSVASTLSLMLPAAGWAKAIGMTGKLTGLGRLSRFASKGIAKLGNLGYKATKFSALENIAGKAGRIDEALRSGAKIGTTAFLSRTGENFMEGRQVYEDTYTKTKENLTNMPSSEYAKFLRMNPEFEGMDKDSIAKNIAQQAANKTFYNDYWMLLMDIPQFKALGSLWGKGIQRATTASERIAAQAAKQRLAGVTEDAIIKNNLKNRIIDSAKYALKHPAKSITALELGEGFEEMYQGVQSQKGLEVAERYFNPNFTPTTISSYLKDSSIWEQGFWGALGGIAFQKVGQGANLAKKKIEAAWNKKHMSADEYERWKQSDNNITIQQLNNITNTASEFTDAMEQIQNGKNPYNYKIDTITGQKIVSGGKVQHEDIDETQQDLLKQEAIDKFVTQVTMDATDNGSYDLFKDVLGSDEFDKYIQEKGIQLGQNDKTVAQQIGQRMDEIRGIYQNTLRSVNSITDTTNPFITIATARQITRSKLAIQDYQEQINAVNNAISDKSPNENFNAYQEKVIYDNVTNAINSFNKQKEKIDEQVAKGEISKSAADVQKRYIDKSIGSLINYTAENTARGALAAVQQSFKDNGANKETIDSFNNVANDFLEQYLNNDNNSSPVEEIDDLIKQKSNIGIRKAINDAQIPVSRQDYQDNYNEYADAMDNVRLNKVNDYINTIRNYLLNAKDYDDAYRKVMQNATGNKKITEAMNYLKVGLNSNDDVKSRKQMLTNLSFSAMLDDINKQRQKNDNNAKSAKENGTPLPEGNPVDNGETTGNEDNNEPESSNPSTGEEQQTSTTETGVSATSATSTTATDNNPQNTTLTDDDGNPIDTTGIDEVSFETESEPEFIPGQDGGTQLDKATNIAVARLAKIYFTQSGMINQIQTEEGFNQFKESVANKLIEDGYDKNTATIAANSAVATVANWITDKSSPYIKLVKQVIFGINKESSKLSDTDLADGKGRDAAIEEFLNHYITVINPTNVIDGKYVINLQTLFDDLLNNQNIDIRTAVALYNNLGQFIAKSNNSNYIFTGIAQAYNQMSSKEFFNAINRNKADIFSSRNQLHISLIEQEQLNSRQRAKYKEALLDIAKGKLKTKIQPYINKQGEVSNLDIIAYDPNNSRRKEVKIAILRTVNSNKDGTAYTTRFHNSGFRNNITIDDNGVHLDCDWFFEDIINKENDDAKELYNYLATYAIKELEARRQFNADEITEKEFEQRINEALPDSFMNNKYIQKLLEGTYYKFYDKINKFKLANDINKILFYGTRDDIDTNLDISNNAMRIFYNDWKNKVNDNYTHTYELQKALEENSGQIVNIDVNIPVINLAHTDEQNNNIADISSIDVDPNGNTPLIMVLNGKYTDENGNSNYSGIPDFKTEQNYSIGFVLDQDRGTTTVGYLNKAIPFDANNNENKKLLTALKGEIETLMMMQYNRLGNDNEAAIFDEIKTRLLDLFSNGGLFNFPNITVVADRNNNFISIIYKKNKRDNQERGIPLITFFRTDRQGHPTTAINFNNLSSEKVNTYTSDNLKSNIKFYNNIINTIFGINGTKTNVTINRSAALFNGNKSNRIFSNFERKDNKLIIKLNNQEIVYDSFADMIIKNRAFSTKLDKTTPLISYVDYRNITADTNIRNVIYNSKNTFVTDIYNKYKHNNRNTIDTNEILKLAGVGQETINVLKNGSVKFITDKVKLDFTDYKDKEKAPFGYYNSDSKNIFITGKGMASMNGNPINAIRLLLHENIHRMFHTSNYSDAERQRIFNDIRELRDFVDKQLETDYTNGVFKGHEDTYNAIRNTLDTAASYENENTQLEEFITESLTQPAIINYFNNTLYKDEVNINGIPQEKKTILQKLMDIILKLFGIKDNNIKKGSILAKEYAILGKTNFNTVTNKVGTADKANKSRKSSPVEGTLGFGSASTSSITIEQDKDKAALDKTKETIDKVITDFSSRITRSNNFETDHTYYLDGKPVETSVTGRIHAGEEVDSKYGVPASALGNTADEAARYYFDNGQTLKGVNISNLTNGDINDSNSKAALQKSLDKIRDYLDKRHGKGKYRVITKEFPIGGIVTDNGVDKTIAGTMDMVVYDTNGDIYIYDFKTKHINDKNGANLSDTTIQEYGTQVNTYRELIIANYPELKDKVKIGGLIKFAVGYPVDENTNYTSKNNKLYLNNTPIEETDDYIAPYIETDGVIIPESTSFINVPQKDISNIKPLPNKPNTPAIDLSAFRTNDGEVDLDTLDSLGIDLNTDEYGESNLDEDDNIQSVAPLADIDRTETSVEVKVNSYVADKTYNPFGVQSANNMNEFLNNHDVSIRSKLRQSLDAGEFNYSCM